MSTKSTRLDEMASGRIRFPGYALQDVWRETRHLNDIVYACDEWGECIETTGVEVEEQA